MNKAFFTTVLSVIGRQYLAVILQVISFIMIARYLGPEGNGTYTLAMIVPSLLMMLFSPSINVGIIYFMGKHQWSARYILTHSLILWAGASLAGLVISLALLHTPAIQLFPAIPKPLLYLAIAIYPPALLQQFCLAILQGYQRFRAYNLISLFGPAFMLTVIGYMWISDRGITGILLGGLLSYCLQLILSLAIIVRLPAVPHAAAPAFWADLKALTLYGLKSYLSNLIAFGNERVDLYLLSHLNNLQNVGIYSVASMISQRLTVISEAINTVLLPHLARLHNPDPHHQAEIVLSMARWTLWITAALAGGVVLASLWLVPLAFGPQYQQVWLPLLILIPSLLSSSISRILAGDISARGRPELNALTAFVALTANIALNVALIPKYAALGAAAAMSLSYTLHLFLRVGLYQRLTGAPLRYFYISRYDALVWQRAQYLFKRPKT